MSTVDSSESIVSLGTVATTPAMLYEPRGAAPGGEEVPGLGAKDVWRIIKQRKVLIIATFCIAYLIIGTATFITYRYFPAYPAEAYVKLILPTADWGKLQETIVPKDYITTRLATEAESIRNPAVLQEVLALPEIKATAFYRWYEGNFDKCLHDFESMLSVFPVRETHLVCVSIAVRDPKEARLIVNKVVDRYVARSTSEMTDQGHEKLESLKNTHAAVTNELNGVRERIRKLREQRDMPALEAERDVMVDAISVLTNTVTELKARQVDVESQLATVHGTDPRNLPVSAEMKVIIEADPVLRYYRQQVEQLEIQIAALSRLMGADHRQIQVLQAQRDGYFDKEHQRREELIDDLRSRQLESLQQEKARIRNMLAEVHEQLIEKENTQRDLDGAIQTFRNLTNDEERLSKELEEVSVALRESENTLDVQSREGRLQKIPAAREAYWPSRPNFALYLGGGFVLSMLVAVGLAFLREFTDQAIRTPLDVARYGHLSVLGSVPLLDDEQVDLDTIELATRRAPQSLVAEAFRQIRAHLTFSGPLVSQQVLLVTSPRPEDGKTATAINLAVTFAQGNQRVLLIDCNFRRPAIRTAFANTRADGLSNVLVGHKTLDEVVTKTELPYLDVMTSGPMPPNPAELLGSAAMRELLAAAKPRYERVILDGPPCLLISDAMVLATQVDATVMVARAANSAKGALRRAREQFARINARIIGAILNGVQARPGGYYRQQYREFYEYTSEEVVPQELPGGPAELEIGSPPSDHSPQSGEPT
jgi:capsular exopolysaccharide synthesis family protein